MRKEQAQRKKTSLGPYIKTPKTERLHLGLETYLSSKSCTQGTVGLPIPTLLKIPVIRGHDLCFDKTCQ